MFSPVVLSQEWQIFFITIIGAATALLGLLYISFSIYITRFLDLDELEVRIGTIYYYEIISSFLIALTALVPPHWWWAGAIIIGIAKLIFLRKTVLLLYTYRHAYRVFEGKSSKKAGEKEPSENQVRMYKLYRAHCNFAFVPVIEDVVVLVAGITGFFMPNGFPLELIGIMIVWYLISSSLGSWGILLQISQREFQQRQR